MNSKNFRMGAGATGNRCHSPTAALSLPREHTCPFGHAQRTAMGSRHHHQTFVVVFASRHSASSMSPGKEKIQKRNFFVFRNYTHGRRAGGKRLILAVCVQRQSLELPVAGLACQVWRRFWYILESGALDVSLLPRLS